MFFNTSSRMVTWHAIFFSSSKGCRSKFCGPLQLWLRTHLPAHGPTGRLCRLCRAARRRRGLVVVRGIRGRARAARRQAVGERRRAACGAHGSQDGPDRQGHVRDLRLLRPPAAREGVAVGVHRARNASARQVERRPGDGLQLVPQGERKGASSSAPRGRATDRDDVCRVRASLQPALANSPEPRLSVSGGRARLRRARSRR